MTEHILNHNLIIHPEDMINDEDNITILNTELYTTPTDQYIVIQHIPPKHIRKQHIISYQGFNNYSLF